MTDKFLSTTCLEFEDVNDEVAVYRYPFDSCIHTIPLRDYETMGKPTKITVTVRAGNQVGQ
jgi:hypothetical protein